MGPVANKAKPGPRKAKKIRRFQARLNSYIAHESKRFESQKAAGGAKAPGSWQ